MPIDYGVWDNIEVSDDEDDTHPHIEKGSLFRWRHQARLERMAETKLELQELYVKKAQATKLLCEIESILNDSTDESREKTIAEKQCQEKIIRECDERIAELEKIARSWNVDTIGRDGFSKTYVNKASSSKLTEDDEMKLAADLRKFGRDKEHILKKFAKIKCFDEIMAFLKVNSDLFSEIAANALAVQCVSHVRKNDEKSLDETARQYLLLKSLVELAKNKCLNPTDAEAMDGLCSQAKANLTSANREIFETELEDFKQTIKKSVSSGAIFRNGDDDAGQNESQPGPSTVDGSSRTFRNTVVQTKQVRSGPEAVPVKPLDPTEVFESLPENMKQCFLKRDVEELERIAMEMNVNDFQYHLQRCIESGLWIPGDE